MKLVSAKEAKVILGFMEMGGLDGSTPSQEKYRLAATVEALWDRVNAAEAELCNGHKTLTAQGVPESDASGKLSITGRVIRLVAERKERRE